MKRKILILAGMTGAIAIFAITLLFAEKRRVEHYKKNLATLCQKLQGKTAEEARDIVTRYAPEADQEAVTLSFSENHRERRPVRLEPWYSDSVDGKSPPGFDEGVRRFRTFCFSYEACLWRDTLFTPDMALFVEKGRVERVFISYEYADHAGLNIGSSQNGFSRTVEIAPSHRIIIDSKNDCTIEYRKVQW